MVNNMTELECFIVDNEDIADVYMADAGYCSNSERKAMYIKAAEKHRQIAEWLRELQDRRKADSCEGCVNESGKANLLVCYTCRRHYHYADLYKPERRTDE